MNFLVINLQGLEKEESRIIDFSKTNPLDQLSMDELEVKIELYYDGIKTLIAE